MAGTVHIEQQGGVHVVRLARAPVNAVEGDLCLDLMEALDALEADPDVQGFILAGRPGVFSAGLDLRKLYPLDPDGMRAFWRIFHATFRRLWATPLVTVAAIEGHAPAGGCVLTLACDHRVMAQGDFRIGLNEVAVGIPVPRWLAEVAVSVMGRSHAERALSVGALAEPAEALRLGFVHEVLPPDAVMARCRQELALRLNAPDGARRGTKKALRASLLESMQAREPGDEDALIAGWFSPECREVMGAMVARLSGR